MVLSPNVQQIYDAHIAGLTADEQLVLVELITRGLAVPEPEKVVELQTQSLVQMPGWQIPDRRSEWRDRAL
jgi:hypothetical protein